MTAAQARVLLEALRDWHALQGQGEGAAFVGRTHYLPTAYQKT